MWGVSVYNFDMIAELEEVEIYVRSCGEAKYGQFIERALYHEVWYDLKVLSSGARGVAG